MIDDRQLDLLIDAVFEYHGYDFSGYSKASLKRRVDRLFQMDGFTHFSEMLLRVRTEPEYHTRLVDELTVNVTEMFRDPNFYQMLRNDILPILGTKPFIRIWHAGCSSGEEVYSMAILLKEANLLHKSLLYGTDINTAVLDVAKKGVFPLRMMQLYSENYMNSGGKKDFSHYYTANYGLAKLDSSLSGRMVFSQHNLVSDQSFNEFDLILCRNVLIYFDKELQKVALELFDNSLSKLGYLALGTKETIKFSTIQGRFKQLAKDKIWKKIS